MIRFLITFGPRKSPRLCIWCCAEDSFAATEKHISRALPGERMEVVAL